MNIFKKKVFIGKPVNRFSEYGNKVVGQLVIIDNKAYLLSEKGEKLTTISPLTGNAVTQFVEVDENSLAEAETIE